MPRKVAHKVSDHSDAGCVVLWRKWAFHIAFSPHMRRVKYGVFKNIQKILKIKLIYFLVPKDAEFFTLYEYTE
jgi:hypothetical protein